MNDANPNFSAVAGLWAQLTQLGLQPAHEPLAFFAAMAMARQQKGLARRRSGPSKPECDKGDLA